MGKENLGYLGMFPLGQSYAMGQWALHEDVQPDPSDPSIPEAKYFDGFYEASQGAPVDRSRWLSEDYANYHAMAVQSIDAIRNVFAAYVANGPLLVDSEEPGSGGFKAEDGVTSVRHIYYYDNQGNYGSHGGAAYGKTTGLGADAAKYVQIQGFTENVGHPSNSPDAGAWVLARMYTNFTEGGQQVFGWRYTADHAGPPYESGGNVKWTAAFNFGTWVQDSQADIALWSAVVAGAILTVITWGAGAAPASALIAAAAVFGIELSEAAAAALVVALTGLAVGAIKYAMTGDSSGLMAGLRDVGADFANLAPEALAAAEKKFPNATAMVDTVVKTVGNVVDDAQAAIKAGAGELQAFTDSASKMATSNFPTIDGDYWNMVKNLVGPTELPGNYFVTLAQMAPSIPDLADIEAKIPWYAKGFLHLGAAVRAAEIAQYKVRTGGGVVAMPAALIKPTLIQQGTFMHAAAASAGTAIDPSTYTRAMPTALMPPIGKTPSPNDMIAAAKAAKAQQTAIVLGAAGLGLAYWLGLLKFLF